MQNNKKLGMQWEKELCNVLAKYGFWVHFLTPDERGAQPFDIIAVKDGKAVAIECKTLSEKQKYFSLTRLEDNQMYAFEKWRSCGNGEPLIAVKQGEKMKVIPYGELLEKERIYI